MRYPPSQALVAEKIQKVLVEQHVEHLETDQGYFPDVGGRVIPRRVVAIRPDGPGQVWIEFHDGDWKQVMYGLGLKQARRLVYGFLVSDSYINYGQRSFEAWINQAWRECWVKRFTPARVRIGFAMPSQDQYGWRAQVLIGDRHYFWSQ